LTYHFVEGARADLTKTISINPLFNFTHSFSLGQKEAPPSWNFNGTYGDERHFMQGGLDDQLNVNMRAHKRLSEGHVLKAQGQVSKERREFRQTLKVRVREDQVRLRNLVKLSD